MALTRLELQQELEELLGSEHVYFQPPENYKMSYPCFVYELNSIPATYADDSPYLTQPTYQVTYIDKDPDSPLVGRISKLRGCRYDRHFTSDNLHHTVFTISTL